MGYPFLPLPYRDMFLVHSVQIHPASGRIPVSGEFRFFINERLYGTAFAEHPVLTFCKGQEDVTEFGLLIPSGNTARVDVSDWAPDGGTLSVTGLMLREIC
jgi:hypothetical protein